MTIKIIEAKVLRVRSMPMYWNDTSGDGKPPELRSQADEEHFYRLFRGTAKVVWKFGGLDVLHSVDDEDVYWVADESRSGIAYMTRVESVTVKFEPNCFKPAKVVSRDNRCQIWLGKSVRSKQLLDSSHGLASAIFNRFVLTSRSNAITDSMQTVAGKDFWERRLSKLSLSGFEVYGLGFNKSTNAVFDVTELKNERHLSVFIKKF